MLGTLLLILFSAMAGAAILAICSATMARQDEGRTHFLLRIFLQGYAAVVLRSLLGKVSERGVERELRERREFLQRKYDLRDEARRKLEMDKENRDYQHSFEFAERIVILVQQQFDYLLGLAFLGGYGRAATRVLSQKGRGRSEASTCPQCGTVVSDTYSFCAQCGTPVQAL